MKIFMFLLLLVSFFSLSAYAEPRNLSFDKMDVERYVASGEYMYDFRQVDNKAEKYLAMRVAQNAAAKSHKKLALVLDIDETSLSNYQHLLANGFGYNETLGAAMVNAADDPALKPTLKLYNFAKAHGVAVFFVTGRKEIFRAVTIKNLEAAGYKDWNALYMAPNDYADQSIIPFKTAMREKIQAAGYDIVESVGDQYSDLGGGHEDRQFKLPDPFYYLP